MSEWIAAVQCAAAALRARVLEHILTADGGYMSQACSSAEMLSTLYLHVLRLGPSAGARIPPPFAGVPGANPAYASGEAYNGLVDPNRDRLIFSPAHYALVLYALLVESGRMGPEGLAQFNRDGSTVEMIGAEHSPGFATTTGSLAQALSQAAGMALGRRLDGAPGRIWVVMSDGECAEGQTWEALAVAAHHHLENLGICIDANGQTCDGTMASVLDLEPLDERIAAFGWTCREVDGHDPQAIAAACLDPHPGRPLAVLCRTDPCRDLPLLRHRAPRLHYLRFADAAEKASYRAVLEAWRGAGREA